MQGGGATERPVFEIKNFKLKFLCQQIEEQWAGVKLLKTWELHIAYLPTFFLPFYWTKL